MLKLLFSIISEIGQEKPPSIERAVLLWRDECANERSNHYSGYVEDDVGKFWATTRNEKLE